jgi:methylenetetrahydrofolate--tRNA-(uracil-5-)-methyltransferase
MIITVIGAGLAGVEAAFTLARSGFRVMLHEMKPEKYSPAHKHPGFAELVCSNSFKADILPGFSLPRSAAALLKAEMRLLGSLTLQAAELTKVAAGGALAVDRTAFSDEITRRIKCEPNIQAVHGEVTDFPKNNAIIATGPLTSDKFAQAIIKHIAAKQEKLLSFYDAAAPIVTADSINMQKAFMASRYSKGEADYINCPFTKEEYEMFYNALISAQTAPLHEFDKHGAKDSVSYYEGCMPVEVLAKRGIDSLRFGCMKPVGLTAPDTGKRPYANLQLRREDAGGTMYNIVGFQTNLKFGEQKRVFSLIPGLENAQFVRYGVMHRNTFINSPKLLDSSFKLRGSDNIYFAGQITGVEGYMESAASGIIAGLAMAGKYKTLPHTTMIGALARFIAGSDTPAEDGLQPQIQRFQPMGASMGLLPPFDGLDSKVRLNKQDKYEKLAQRALNDLEKNRRCLM